MVNYSRPGKWDLVGEPPAFGPMGAAVEFRLTYAGELLASGNKGRPEVKHRLRKHFHKQLAVLWSLHPGLKSLAESKGVYETVPYIKRLSDNFQTGDFMFAPMVTEKLSLLCSIEILMLTVGARSSIIAAGDIDGRLKTIFDSLKRPKHKEEIAGLAPDDDENPFYCLLEDDSLITHVAVETDHLLEPIADGVPKLNDARLVIAVKLSPYAGPVMNDVFR